MSDETRYEFGANWQSYVKHALNEQRVAHAVTSMREFLGVETLRGRRVLDIGCGSGLFSLAAHLLEAEHVESFDYDANSVAATRSLQCAHGVADERWTVRQGSVLDAAFMATVQPADVVYSWGVLHHTGHMWEAIDAAATRVLPGGRFAISIYNKVERFPDSSRMWWHLKRTYTRGPAVVRRLMEAGYVANFVLTRLVTLRNPISPFLDREGAGRRGMEFMHDVRDWLGGFPYEYATSGEIFQHVHSRAGFELERLVNWEGNACNELLFRRP
ncbi:MAG: class I SAM-dependent methyltransferase [Candidatus Eisenbacteria bacterium]|uniref:Class I SAM-dependent methyltransferase n=1 Tax=Eiseniibacteriota bacterium TaxID=2212470 RepID=A0A849SQH7_UNCEI|nr:class I SAM-dependent methyltransferase [Candidatus Eisenbacteria bacterium]